MAAKNRKETDEEAQRITEANKAIRRQQSEDPDPGTDLPRAEQGYESHRLRSDKDDDEPVRSGD